MVVSKKTKNQKLTLKTNYHENEHNFTAFHFTHSSPLIVSNNLKHSKSSKFL